ncbi:MAG TPA: hypothetical protein VN253_09935 [Kofleriaceae bacterium]|nr:hypothetical protein [Kofleriaceae bacterium]
MIDRSRLTRTAQGTIETSPPRPATRLPVDDHELDDAFSAWDEDDDGARQSAPAARLAQATGSTAAKTIIGHKPLAEPPPSRLARPPSDPGIRLVDPVSMHDIVLSRARTIDDPLTTQLLAEISRSDLMNERASRERPLGPDEEPPAPRRTTRRGMVRPEDEPFRKK